jgi:hypothetical protein
MISATIEAGEWRDMDRERNIGGEQYCKGGELREKRYV